MCAQLRKQEAMRGDPAGRFEHPQGSGDEVRCLWRCCQRRQRQTQGWRLLLKTANPELAALVGHGGLRGSPGGGFKSELVEQTCDQEQRDHRDAESEPGQGELRE